MQKTMSAQLKWPSVTTIRASGWVPTERGLVQRGCLKQFFGGKTTNPVPTAHEKQFLNSRGLLHCRSSSSFNAAPSDLSAAALAKADSLQLKELLDRDFSVIQNRLHQAGADDFTGMNGDDSASAIEMFQEVMTAFDSNDLKTCLPQRSNHLTASTAWLHGDALHADELRHSDPIALDFQTQLNRFPHPFHEGVQRLGLRVATFQLRHERHIVAGGITLDNHTKFASGRLHAPQYASPVRTKQADSANRVGYSLLKCRGRLARVIPHAELNGRPACCLSPLARPHESSGAVCRSYFTEGDMSDLLLKMQAAYCRRLRSLLEAKAGYRRSNQI